MNALNGLASRLTDQHDRETYAALVSYFDSLPPGDEMGRLIKLLGLLSLIGQRIPDAAAELLVELRASASTAGELNAALDARLSHLTSEISAGIDVSALSRAMAETVRQAAGSELQEVRDAAKSVTEQLRLLTKHSAGASALIVQERGRLTNTVQQLQHAAATLQGEAKTARAWLWGLACGVSFLAGSMLTLWIVTSR